jgi:hypothetical protein
MFRHIVLLTIAPDAPAGAVDEILAGLESLPGAIPEIGSYRYGTDLGLADGNATIGIVADFEDESAYVVYRDHPVHRQVIEERILPVLRSRSAIQMTL